MCGRAACTLAPRALQQRLGAQTFEGQENYRASYNVGPGRHQPILVCRVNADGTITRHIVTMRWGLMPSWSKSALGGGPREPINARSETIAEKPTFKKLVSGKRCIVPADGYFEWQKLNSKQRQPFFFRFPATVKRDPNETQEEEKKEFIKYEHEEDGADDKKDIKIEFDPEQRHPLTMAGLYDVWQNRETGEKIYTYCIITVPSAKKTQFVHDRMPAIIDPSLVDMWLSPNIPFEEVAPLLTPYEDIEYYPVSNVVGNVRNDSIECVLPVSVLKTEVSSPTKSPVKAITNFFKSVKDDPIKEEKIKYETDESFDVDDIEVLEETTTESRYRKRKERVKEFKVKSEHKYADVIDLDDEDDQDEVPETKPPVTKRVKREPAPTADIVVLGD